MSCKPDPESALPFKNDNCESCGHGAWFHGGKIRRTAGAPSTIEMTHCIEGCPCKVMPRQMAGDVALVIVLLDQDLAVPTDALSGVPAMFGRAMAAHEASLIVVRDEEEARALSSQRTSVFIDEADDGPDKDAAFVEIAGWPEVRTAFGKGQLHVRAETWEEKLVPLTSDLVIEAGTPVYHDPIRGTLVHQKHVRGYRSPRPARTVAIPIDLARTPRVVQVEQSKGGVVFSSKDNMSRELRRARAALGRVSDAPAPCLFRFLLLGLATAVIALAALWLLWLVAYASEGF